jgi:broad specificity phosphatase PhoE
MQYHPPCPADDECLLYLIRHGATENNLAKPAVLQGRGLDSPLSAQGRAEAEATAAALERHPISAVYASPLLRARQTAELIAAPHGAAAHVVDALVEADVGQWEGRTWQDIRKAHAEAYARFMEDPGKHPYVDGENLTDVQQRVVPALEDLLSRHPGGVIVAVAHNVVNRAFLAHLLNLPLAAARGIRQDNCGLNLIRRRGEQSTLVTVNSVFHLPLQVVGRR